MATEPASAAFDVAAFERARRAGARRTAWIVGGIALAVFVGFVLRGVLLA
jgi:hypothetical protein